MTYMGDGPGWECHHPRCPSNRATPGETVQPPDPPLEAEKLGGFLDMYRYSIVQCEEKDGQYGTRDRERESRALLLAEFTRLSNKLKSWNMTWGPMIDFAQSKGHAMGLKPGADIPAFLIETMKQKVEAKPFRNCNDMTGGV